MAEISFVSHPSMAFEEEISVSLLCFGLGPMKNYPRLAFVSVNGQGPPRKRVRPPIVIIEEVLQRRRLSRHPFVKIVERIGERNHDQVHASMKNIIWKMCEFQIKLYDALWCELLVLGMSNMIVKFMPAVYLVQFTVSASNQLDIVLWDGGYSSLLGAIGFYHLEFWPVDKRICGGREEMASAMVEQREQREILV
ncbi:hypothetical protein POM88_013281 [Heracleum sosnowskyi]|uniref:Uncharacterized protein n=1 Tax=Heracleum sosnowskyi TaxID=360622 RepID=A0AAD8J1V4_9APIA|nr:hypothetical protein POM88_013281 [Heracleum sosnowskyi]